MTSAFFTQRVRLWINTLLIAIAVAGAPVMAAGQPHLYGPIGKSETLESIAIRVIGKQHFDLRNTMADINYANPDTFITGDTKFLPEDSFLSLPEYLLWNTGLAASGAASPTVPTSSHDAGSKEDLMYQIQLLKQELAAVQAELETGRQESTRLRWAFYLLLLIVSLVLLAFAIKRFAPAALQKHEPVAEPQPIAESAEQADKAGTQQPVPVSKILASAMTAEEPVPSAPLTAIHEPKPSAASTDYNEPTPAAPSMAYDEPTPAAPSMAYNEPTPAAPSMAYNEPTPAAPSMAYNEPTPAAPSIAYNEPTPAAPSMALASEEVTPAAPVIPSEEPTVSATALAFDEPTPAAPAIALGSEDPTPTTPIVPSEEPTVSAAALVPGYQASPVEIMNSIDEIPDAPAQKTNANNISDINEIIDEISGHFKGMSKDKEAANLVLARVYMELGDYEQAEPLLTSVHKSSVPEYAKQADEMIHELLQAKIFASSFNQIIDDLPNDGDSTVARQLDDLSLGTSSLSSLSIVSDSFMPDEADEEAGRQLEMAQIFLELGDYGRCKQHLAAILGSDSTAFLTEANELLREINDAEAVDNDVTTKAPLLPGGDGNQPIKKVISSKEPVVTEEQLDEISSHFMAISSNANGTKLALANVHYEMGKQDAAKKLIVEIIDSGDTDLTPDAQALLNRITNTHAARKASTK